MKRLVIISLSCLTLAGCVQVGGTAFYETYEVPPRGTPAYCEHYAEQTFLTAYENLREPGEGFGPNVIAQAQAERQAERAYRRCLSGRLN